MLKVSLGVFRLKQIGEVRGHLVVNVLIDMVTEVAIATARQRSRSI